MGRQPLVGSQAFQEDFGPRTDNAEGPIFGLVRKVEAAPKIPARLSGTASQKASLSAENPSDALGWGPDQTIADID
jgi:hypothetical protein